MASRGFLSVTLEDARLSTLDPTKPSPPGPQLRNLTGPVRQFGGAILCFIGPPNRSVEWRMVEGEGTLTPYSTYTDKFGQASCRFDSAGIPGRVVVGVAYVP